VAPPRLSVDPSDARKLPREGHGWLVRPLRNHRDRVVEISVLMPAPRRHQWHLAFDRIRCRDCGLDEDDAGPVCTGAVKIRPQAAIRQQTEGRA
jgi:hypothetical protein